MKAKITWYNGYEFYKEAYFNETLNEFTRRILKNYQRYDVRILLQIDGDEGYYIN